MIWLLFLYIGLGFMALLIELRCIKRKHVNPTLLAFMSDPGGFIIGLFLWPVLFLNDVYLEIPMQKKDLLEVIKKERDQKRTLRRKEKELRSIIGQKGIAVTDLKYSGKVNIDGHVWDAFSETGIIEKNKEIIVSNRRIMSYE